MTLALALILDALFGEPRWLWSRLPHPAVVMGRAIKAAESRFNNRTRVAGVVVILALTTGAALLGLGLQALPGSWAEILCAAILLAQRSLSDHVLAVARGLDQGIESARRAVARIVGRETGNLETPAVSRAAIESAAENLSDGVVAPAFWFLIFGLPGMLVYKMVNTADSMIGYRTEEHLNFGWAAARLDDLLNWLPSRLTALLIMLAALRPAAFRIVLRDGHLHRSPNAGRPEAAMAAALGVALSGPRSYDGRMRTYPFVNGEGQHDIGAAEIRAATRLLWRSWVLLLLFVIVIWLA